MKKLLGILVLGLVLVYNSYSNATTNQDEFNPYVWANPTSIKFICIKEPTKYDDASGQFITKKEYDRVRVSHWITDEFLENCSVKVSKNLNPKTFKKIIGYMRAQSSVTIPKSLYITKELFEEFKDNLLSENQQIITENQQIIEKKKEKEEAKLLAKKIAEEKTADKFAKKELLQSLENKYGKDCEKSFFSFFKEGYKKGSVQYEDCLISKNNKSIADMKKIAEEKKLLEKKLSKMGQMERIQYQCENVFNFYKHSKKFKDCTLQVYIAEAEAKKIELEKEVLLAKLETQKLKLETAKLKLEVSKAEEAKKQAKLEKQQAFELEKKRLADLENQKKLLVKKEKSNAKGLGSFLDLVSVGLQIYSLTSGSPSVSSGSSGTKALQCFTSGMFQYCN